MTVRKHSKPVYLKPESEAVRVDSCELLDASDGDGITNLPSGNVNVFPDEDGKDPVEALGKEHSGIWDDGWDDAGCW